MSDDGSGVRDLLRSAADVPLPVRIDVAAVVAEGDRAVRRRRVGRAVAGVAACAAVVGTFTAVPLLRPDHLGTRADAPAAPATPSRPPPMTGPSAPMATAPSQPHTAGAPADGTTPAEVRMMITLGEVLPLPAADLTEVDGREPMVFYRSDTAYTAVADIRDRDGIGSISVRVEPATFQPSTDPCAGQAGVCVPVVRPDAMLGIVDIQVGRDGHRWRVIAARRDDTLVVVEGVNWSEEKRRTTGATPFTAVGRADAPLTTNQMIRVATAKGLYWG